MEKPVEPPIPEPFNSMIKGNNLNQVPKFWFKVWMEYKTELDKWEQQELKQKQRAWIEERKQNANR